MANTKIKEPYVKVDEVIMKAPTVASTASTSNIGGVIVSPIGPRLAYITSPVEFLNNYTIDGTIPRNADITFINAYYLSYYSGLVISRSLNTNALGGVLIYQNEQQETAFSKYITKDDMILKNGAKAIIQVTMIDGKEPGWAFVMNDVVYYSSQISINTISSMPKYMNYSLFKECESIYDLVSIFENTDGIHVDKVDPTADGSKITIYFLYPDDPMSDDQNMYLNTVIPNQTSLKDITININELDSSNPTDKAVLDKVTLPEKSSWIFSIIGDVPLSSDSNTIKLGNYNSTTKAIDLYLNTDAYRVSVDQDATENGVNIYIDYINTQNTGYNVTVYNNDATFNDLVVDSESETENGYIIGSFGESGFNEKEAKKDSHIFEALDYLADQEIYDVEYLAPFGLTNANIAKRFQMISSDKKWFCPIDIPSDMTTYTSVKRFMEAFIQKYENMPTGIMLGPFDRNSSLTGWYNDIAASTLYYERIMLNKQSNAEFAPVFRSDYGQLNYTNPYKLFKKTERTDLLSLKKPINWVVYSQKDDIYYLNDNRTFQEDQESVVGEEQNARIVWKISKDVAKVVEQFIGKYNTRTTRASVVDAIKYYLDWNIMSKKFPPEDYLIQCDEYNNPDSLINENKLAVELKIRLYKAIKYVEVINRVFPLGVDFSTSI